MQGPGHEMPSSCRVLWGIKVDAGQLGPLAEGYMVVSPYNWW